MKRKRSTADATQPPPGVNSTSLSPPPPLSGATPSLPPPAPSPSTTITVVPAHTEIKGKGKNEHEEEKEAEAEEALDVENPHTKACNTLLKTLGGNKFKGRSVTPEQRLDQAQLREGLRRFAVWASRWREVLKLPAKAKQEEAYTTGLLYSLLDVPGLFCISTSRTRESALGPDFVLVTRDRLIFVQSKYVKTPEKGAKVEETAEQLRKMAATAAWFQAHWGNSERVVASIYLFYVARPHALHWCYHHEAHFPRKAKELRVFDENVISAIQ